MGFLMGNKKMSGGSRSFMGKIPRRVELEKKIIRELKPHERRKYKEYFSGVEVGNKSIKSLAQGLLRDQGAREKRKFLIAVKEHYEKNHPVLNKDQKERNISMSKMSEIINYEKEKGGIGARNKVAETQKRVYGLRHGGSEADLGTVGFKQREKEGAHFAGDVEEGKRTSSISSASNKSTPGEKPVSSSKPLINPLGR